MPYLRRTRRPRRLPARRPTRRPRKPMYRRTRIVKARSRYSVNVPPMQKVALKYNELFNISLNAGNSYTWSYIFRPNDMYDPNFTGTGHQSMFRDQWYTLYEYARCVAFKFKVTFFTDSDAPLDVSLGSTESNSGIPFEYGLETKGFKTRTIQKYKPAVLNHGGLTDRVLHNPKRTCLIDDTFKQPAGTSLPDKATCWVQMGAIARASSTTNLWVRVQILQYARFVEPIWQSQS